MKRSRSIKDKFKYFIKTKLFFFLRHLNIYQQKVASLELFGISHDTVDHLIEDSFIFNKEYNKLSYDPSRILLLLISLEKTKDIPGHILECGVYQGSTARLLRWQSPLSKTLFLSDTFEGFTDDNIKEEMKATQHSVSTTNFTNTSLNFVKDVVFKPMKNTEPPFSEDSVQLIKGPIEETYDTHLKSQTFSLIHLDMDLYAPTKFAISKLKDQLSKGGILILHDYFVPKKGYVGVKKACDELDMSGLSGPFYGGDQASAFYVKN